MANLFWPPARPLGASDHSYGKKGQGAEMVLEKKHAHNHRPR
jgi:hypothetical protein